MGCGCQKKSAAGIAANAGPRRITVYAVMVGTDNVGEFTTLPEARAKAVEVGGRVKVSSKVEGE